MTQIVTKCGFLWVLLNEEQSEQVFNNEDFDGYIIFPDTVQIQRIKEEDLHLPLTNSSLPIAIEMGHEAELKADWQEATARNNEKRSFEAWINDKAENLIN